MRSRHKLRNLLNSRVDAFENYADAPAALPPNKTTLAATQGNPPFTAQFDVSILLKFFTVSAGTYTEITGASLAAPLKTKLPAFLFGNSDFGGGFARLRAAFPLSVWQYDAPFVYGVGGQKGTVYGELDATARAVLLPGDLVIPVYAASGGTNYVSFTIIRCSQVAYGTLLDAISSDMFWLNMIRYIMSDTSATGLAQYQNNINIFKQSLFGKFDSDFVSPNSFKLPEQMQSGIIDIPLQKGIDKQVALATLVNFDTPVVQWSLFVAQVAKIAA